MWVKARLTHKESQRGEVRASTPTGAQRRLRSGLREFRQRLEMLFGCLKNRLSATMVHGYFLYFNGLLRTATAEKLMFLLTCGILIGLYDFSVT